MALETMLISKKKKRGICLKYQKRYFTKRVKRGKLKEQRKCERRFVVVEVLLKEILRGNFVKRKGRRRFVKKF